jgi:hypothetical protein
MASFLIDKSIARMRNQVPTTARQIWIIIDLEKGGQQEMTTTMT